MKQRPADALNPSAKAHVGIAEQEDLGIHAGLDPGKKSFAEICQHVPIAIIDQAHHLLALVGVLAHSDIEVGDVAVERRLHVAVLNIQPRLVGRRFSGLAARVDIAVLAELVGGARDFALRALHRCARGGELAPGARDVVGGDEIFAEQRSDSIKVLLIVGAIGFELSLPFLGGGNRVVERPDL